MLKVKFNRVRIKAFFLVLWEECKVIWRTRGRKDYLAFAVGFIVGMPVCGSCLGKMVKRPAWVDEFAAQQEATFKWHDEQNKKRREEEDKKRLEKLDAPVVVEQEDN